MKFKYTVRWVYTSSTTGKVMGAEHIARTATEAIKVAHEAALSYSKVTIEVARN